MVLVGVMVQSTTEVRRQVSPAVTQLHPDAEAIFKDSDLVHFQRLPEAHSEQELRRSS
jgi:hypothetical protein